MKSLLAAVMVVGCGLSALFLSAGCEEVNTDSALIILPDKAVLTNRGDTVTLTVWDADYPPPPDMYPSGITNLQEKILLPLEWRVSNPALGIIAAQGGYTAIYESSGRIGQNYIWARDRGGREGVAAIEQRRPPETNMVTTTTAE